MTDFEEFVIVDCRSKPNIKYALTGNHKSFRFTDYANKEKFAEIYYLLSKEAVSDNSIENYANKMLNRKTKVTQKLLFKGGYQAIDDSFLEYIDGVRLTVAQSLKKADHNLDSEMLTEATQRTVDRLVFIRFLEDKLIEPVNYISEWAASGNAWKAFISDCKMLNAKYNGVVFKPLFIDKENFAGADEKLFGEICNELCSDNSPYDFNYIPIHILGSIYERFLGKVVIATAKQVRIEEKPEVRKAGGVYYTPKYIVDYIVANTVGKLIAGLTPAQIAGTKQRPGSPPLEGLGESITFADIACGSGSFLIGVYDYLLQYHKTYYTKYPSTAQKDGCINIDGVWALSINQKQNILLNNIYGVDIDSQAVEVTQLSLFLKMLEDESLTSTMAQAKQTSMYTKVLPDLTKNIVCGNSLIGTDILTGTLFTTEEERKLNPMDFKTTFPKVFKNGGFDAVVGNPPYLSTKGIKEVEKKYFSTSYQTAKGQFDLYGLFIEKGFNILQKNGKLGYITSNTFLSNKDFVSLRKLLLEKCEIETIANFGETVFKDANLDVCVLIFMKGFNKNLISLFRNSIDFFANNVYNISQTTFINEADNYEIQIKLDEGDSLFFSKLFKNKKTLGSYLSLPRGIELGSNSDKIINNHKVGYSKLLVGKNIKKYEINFNDFFIKFENNEKSVFKELNIYNQPKILIQRIRNLSLHTRIVATLDSENYLCTNTLRIGILIDKTFKIEFFLAILNSKVINYLFSKKFLNKDIYAYQLDRIPIPNLDFSNKSNKTHHDTLVNLVEQMLATKKQLQTETLEKNINYLTNKCTSIDAQIDALVYTLYGLTAEEIGIVEGG